MDASISRQFAQWAASLRYDDLPPEVIDKAKALLLHSLTGAAIGSQTAKAKHAVHLTLEEEPKHDGATILVNGAKATRIGATFANAETIHASDLLDSYRMLTHPGPILVPAALANAELGGKTGKDVLVALIAGYEFLFRLCDDFIPSTAARGFRPSPIYGTMGAAMVAGKLMDLDEDRLVAAISIAAHCASGLFSGGGLYGGGGEGSIHEPNAARQGVFAALMARDGQIRGSEMTIEGPSGFYNAFTGNANGNLAYAFNGPMRVDLASVTQGLGSEYRLLTAMFRMYPLPGYNQPVIDLIVEMMLSHHLDAADIDSLDVSMNYLETLYPSPAFPQMDPYRPAVGQAHYYAAHAAVNGGVPVVGGRTFGPTGRDLARDQAVLDFMAAHVRLIPVWGQAMFSPTVLIRARNGALYSGTYPYARMEWDFAQLVERLQECLPGYPGGKSAFDRLVDATRSADEWPSMHAIYEVLAAPQ